MYEPKSHFLVIDLETTGLDPERDQILECFAQLRDSSAVLNEPVAEFHRLVKPTGDGLRRMGEQPEVLRMHTETGLLLDAVSYGGTQDQLLLDLESFLSPVEQVTLLGNSVHFDLGFLRALEQRFGDSETEPVTRHIHYRLMDTSAIAMLFGTQGLDLDLDVQPGQTSLKHRAQADVEHCWSSYCNAVAVLGRLRKCETP